MKIQQKNLFNDSVKTTTYIKIPITNEIRKQRLYCWLNKQYDIFIDSYRSFNYGELQEHDIYTGESGEIVLADWNNTPKGLHDYIEGLGISTGWCDEYSSCECGKLIQTQPNCYGWTPNYLITDCELLCRECIEGNIDIITDKEYQDSYFIDNDDIALPYWTIELIEKEGFIRYENEKSEEESYESGWYPGQNDTPEKVLESLDIDIDKYDRLWVIDGSGQFDIAFSLYLRLKNKNQD